MVEYPAKYLLISDYLNPAPLKSVYSGMVLFDIANGKSILYPKQNTGVSVQYNNRN